MSSIVRSAYVRMVQIIQYCTLGPTSLCTFTRTVFETTVNTVCMMYVGSVVECLSNLERATAVHKAKLLGR